jgi:predicted dehydrogenase
MKKIGVALIGCGGITLQNHLPGLALCPEAHVVALCDSDPVCLEKARRQSNIEVTCRDYQEVLRRDDVHAVIIATPNYLHAPIVLAAIAAGKHVLCEKPLAMNHPQTVEMLRAAESAGVRHMTAFTYRFVPAMRYMARLIAAGDIGEPFHFRSCRLQDWGRRNLGWRQKKELAGTGELGDMLSHRIDYAHLLVGPMRRLVADTRRYHDDRGGHASNLEDWVGILAEFSNHATGMLESSKVAGGRGEGAQSQDYCEVNGSEGTLVFQLERPHLIQVGRTGQGGLSTLPVPLEFLTWPGSPRDPRQGDPLISFRYDQDVEFIRAILAERDCIPSFREGVAAQQVMDAAILSAGEKRWVELPEPSSANTEIMS